MPRGRAARRERGGAPRLLPCHGRAADPALQEAPTSLLEIALSAAVPLRIEELRRVPPEERAERAQGLADVVAAHGDDVLYRSARKGGSAEAFNALAEGLAVLAFQPGGVRFGSQRREA